MSFRLPSSSLSFVFSNVVSSILVSFLLLSSPCVYCPFLSFLLLSVSFLYFTTFPLVSFNILISPCCFSSLFHWLLSLHLISFSPLFSSPLCCFLFLHFILCLLSSRLLFSALLSSVFCKPCLPIHLTNVPQGSIFTSGSTADKLKEKRVRGNLSAEWLLILSL